MRYKLCSNIFMVLSLPHEMKNGSASGSSSDEGLRLIEVMHGIPTEFFTVCAFSNTFKRVKGGLLLYKWISPFLKPAVKCKQLLRKHNDTTGSFTSIVPTDFWFLKSNTSIRL